MRIAIVHPTLALRGGAESVVLWMMEELSRRGHQVDVYTTEYDAGLHGPRESHGGRIVTLPMGGYGWNPWVWRRAGRLLQDRLQAYDVINPHNFPAYLWTDYAKRNNRRLPPIVWFCEEPMRAFYEEALGPHAAAAFRADMRIGLPTTFAGKAARRLRAQGLLAPFHLLGEWLRHWRERAVMVPLRWLDARAVGGMDLRLGNSEFIAGLIRKVFAVAAQPCLLGVPIGEGSAAGTVSPAAAPGVPSAPFILTVTRLTFEKNLFNVLRAVKLLADRGRLPVSQWIIAGQGPLKDRLQAFNASLGLEGIVEVRGFVDAGTLSALYAAAALIVYLPLDETFGLVIPEAGLHRKAVVGPNQGGPAELVVEGITGWTVDPLNPEAIAAAVVKACADPEALRRMGENHYRHVMETLTFPRFVDRFLERLASVVPPS